MTASKRLSNVTAHVCATSTMPIEEDAVPALEEQRPQFSLGADFARINSVQPIFLVRVLCLSKCCSQVYTAAVRRVASAAL